MTFTLGWLWMKVDKLEKVVAENAKPALYDLMTQMQQVVHKMSYAVEFENKELLDFYIHELEELSGELIITNMNYNDYPVGQLTRSMLYPSIEDLEDAIDSGDWSNVRTQKSILIQSCNSCHIATGYKSVIILERAGVNPFNQNFSTEN